jgi:hypothetical protein
MEKDRFYYRSSCKHHQSDGDADADTGSTSVIARFFPRTCKSTRAEIARTDYSSIPRDPICRPSATLRDKGIRGSRRCLPTHRTCRVRAPIRQWPGLAGSPSSVSVHARMPAHRVAARARSLQPIHRPREYGVLQRPNRCAAVARPLLLPRTIRHVPGRHYCLACPFFPLPWRLERSVGM